MSSAAIYLQFSLSFLEKLLLLEEVSNYRLYVAVICTVMVVVLLAVAVTCVMTWRRKDDKTSIVLRRLAGLTRVGVALPPLNKRPGTKKATEPSSGPTPKSASLPQSQCVNERVLVSSNEAYGTGGELSLPLSTLPPPPYPGDKEVDLQKVDIPEYDYICNGRTYTAATAL